MQRAGLAALVSAHPQHRRHAMLGQRGAANRGVTVLVVILAVALVVVMYLWMQDRESQDVQLEIGSAVTAIGGDLA